MDVLFTATLEAPRRSGERRAEAYCIGAMTNGPQCSGAITQRKLTERRNQPSAWDQIVYFNCLDLYHTSPDSGECHYKSKTSKSRFDPALLAGDRGEHRDCHVHGGPLADAARGLGGSSNSPLKHVQFALAQRRIRLCHPRKALNSRTDLSLLAAQIPRARLQAPAWIYPLAHHPGTFLSFIFDMVDCEYFVPPNSGMLHHQICTK